MKIEVFQSQKGDCLLLTGADGKRVLVDGGMPDSYDAHVAPALAAIRDAGETIDVVYVSHIDQDHIAGVLKMTDDLIAWRIFDFQSANGNTAAKKPKVPRPADFSQVWNNAFHEQVGENTGPIEEMLAARARALTLIPKEFAREAAENYNSIAHSTGEAIRLSRRLGKRQLNVPVNPEFGGGLMFVTDPPDPLRVGTMEFTVIGPFKEDLENLRKEWNAWLETQKAQDQLARIRRKNEEQEGDLRDAIGVLLAQAAQLGDRKKVTLPNLASLMFYVEEPGGPTLLLTGDGHWQDIIAGLENCGKLVPGAGLHVNVLKVQHHGSEHNWHHDFARRITADNYIICGNGAHKNPDLKVIDSLLESRLGPPSKRSPNPEAANAFKVWCNASSANPGEPANKAHMKLVEKKLAAAEAANPGRLTSHFLTTSSFTL